MKLSLPQIRFLAVILAVAVTAFAGGFWSGKQEIKFEKEGFRPKVTISREVPQEHQDVSFGLFWEVWDRLEASYFDKTKLEHEKMVYGAISGMVSSIGDPYTVFLPPSEQKRTREDLGGEFEGVGIQIGFKGTQLAVIAPLEGSPAQQAGVEAGDFIIGIKDKNRNIEMGTVGIALPEAVETIRGPAGTAVTLVLTRSGTSEPFEKEIVREKIEVPSVLLSFEGQDKNIAHLKLLRFGEQTNGEWDSAISKIKKQKAKGLILDMRNNPGGFLTGAVSIISEFVNRGVAVLREDGNGNRQELSVHGRPKLPEIRLVVLVNKGSASASEIVAGALKDHRRAEIVGSATFGKGTVQEAQEIGASGLHITTERWLTPKGTWVNTVGLKPDVEVENSSASPEDEQLLKALELLE